MKTEMRIALLLFVIAVFFGRFVDSSMACFVVGMCTVMGILLSFISWLPEKVYDSLLYRRFATVKNKRN